jgi:hypothetical protein
MLSWLLSKFGYVKQVDINPLALALAEEISGAGVLALSDCNTTASSDAHLHWLRLAVEDVEKGVQEGRQDTVLIWGAEAAAALAVLMDRHGALRGKE